MRDILTSGRSRLLSLIASAALLGFVVVVPVAAHVFDPTPTSQDNVLYTDQTAEPSETPEPVESPDVTSVQLEATESPEPTETPEPTGTPEPTESEKANVAAEPTETPEPTESESDSGATTNDQPSSDEHDGSGGSDSGD